MDMRGLSTFIADIRKSKSKDDQDDRIKKELAKIRAKFQNTTKMNGYDRKKYICKLLYIYMLGYDLDFGHIEAVNLLSSPKYSERHIGYLACTILLNETHELLTLITNSIKRDLNVKEQNTQCLALTTIANVGGKEFSESLAQDVQKLLVGDDTRTIVRKKAALTLLRLYRKYPEILPPDTWSSRVISLLGSKNLGLLTSLLSLMIALVSVSPNEYKSAIPKVVQLLDQLVINGKYSTDYIYYGIPAPWLQVKLFRLLQFYPPPEEKDMKIIIDSIDKLITASQKIKSLQKGKSVSRVNSSHAVLFEALNCAIHYDNDSKILAKASHILSRYLQDKDTNLRYLALDTMSRLAYSQHESVLSSIRKNQDTILLALKDNDISIRRRALDLLYSMCNKENASGIVGELLEYLAISDYAIREELVLKIAILSEKFASEFTWYVDVILTLISQAGDFVSNEIWYRVIQIITNRKDEKLQEYAAKTVFNVLSQSAVHENAIRIGAYILGEFGYLIAEQKGTSPLEQFKVLQSKFTTSKNSTKCLLLSTFVKFYNLYEDESVRDRVKKIFQSLKSSFDSEIQQRSVEYEKLVSSLKDDVLQELLEPMPVYEARESSVLKKILERQNNLTEKGLRTLKHKREEVTEKSSDSDVKLKHNKEDTKSNTSTTGSLIELDDQKSTNEPEKKKEESLDDFLGILSNANNEDSKNTPTIIDNSTPSNKSDDIDILGDILGSTSLTDNSSKSTQKVEDKTSIANETANIAKQKQKEREGTSIEEIMSITNETKGSDQVLVKKASEQSTKLIALTGQGIAIEDEIIQVSVKSEFHGPKGRIGLYLGNKSGKVISQLRVNINTINEIQFQFSQIAPLIAPSTQVNQIIMVSCLTPFDKEIEANIYFEYNKSPYRFDVKLPIMNFKFIEPLSIPNQQSFFGLWNSIQKGEPNEKQVVFKAIQQIDITRIKNLLSKGFCLQILNNIDSNPNNIIASGRFYAIKEKTIEILVRLETNPKANAYRLTVKTPNGLITNSVTSHLQYQIA